MGRGQARDARLVVHYSRVCKDCAIQAASEFVQTLNKPGPNKTCIPLTNAEQAQSLIKQLARINQIY
jgi:hypothetical protein